MLTGYQNFSRFFSIIANKWPSIVFGKSWCLQLPEPNDFLFFSWEEKLVAPLIAHLM